MPTCGTPWPNKAENKDLDKLVGDKDANVRTEVALQGRDKDLDKLVFDKNVDVRWAVARQCRDKDLDKLVDDKDEGVSYFAKMKTSAIFAF